MLVLQPVQHVQLDMYGAWQLVSASSLPPPFPPVSFHLPCLPRVPSLSSQHTRANYQHTRANFHTADPGSKASEPNPPDYSHASVSREEKGRVPAQNLAPTSTAPPSHSHSQDRPKAARGHPSTDVVAVAHAVRTHLPLHTPSCAKPAGSSNQPRPDACIGKLSVLPATAMLAAWHLTST